MATLYQHQDQPTTESTLVESSFQSTDIDDKNAPYFQDPEKLNPTFSTDSNSPADSDWTKDSTEEESKEELYGWTIVFVAFLVQSCIAGVTSCWYSNTYNLTQLFSNPMSLPA